MEQELLDAKRKEREKKEDHRIKMVELKHNLDLQIHQRDQGIKAFNGLSAVETVMNKVSEWVGGLGDYSIDEHMLVCIAHVVPDKEDRRRPPAAAAGSGEGEPPRSSSGTDIAVGAGELHQQEHIRMMMDG